MPEEIQKQLTLDRDPHGNVQVSKIESERLLIEMVKNELKERQKKGSYKGQFNAQPLFFGYEGRSCFPTLFDAHYCYALGHTAALLIDHGFTGYMAVINKLNERVDNWQISGVPLVNMIHLENRSGKVKPVIKKALVDLKGAPFKTFAAHRKKWELEDAYVFPGPIQFYGPAALNFSITKTLDEESKRK
jgi:pyrophosphate--fructose-6-phosphate 1-phosphotransferase